MSNARIGYINLLESGTVAASSESPDFPVANAFDWLTGDWFKPASVPGGITNIDLTLSVAASADYFAFYGQNLYSLGGSIKLQWWNGSAYVDCFAAMSPADNSPQMVAFTSQTSTKWRVVVTCASIFSLAAISFGPQLNLPYGMYLGWTAPVLARDTTLVTSKADGGAFLGRSVIARGVSTAINLQGAPDAWVRANWLPFVKVAEKRAFFFIPDIVGHPGEAVFCWVEDAVPQPSQTYYGFMSASIPIKGLVE